MVRHIFGVREVLVNRVGEGTGGGGGDFAVDRNVVVLMPAVVATRAGCCYGSCWKFCQFSCCWKLSPSSHRWKFSVSSWCYDDPAVRDETDRDAVGRRCTLVAVSSAGSFRGFTRRCWKFSPTPRCWNFATSRDAGGLVGVRDGSPRNTVGGRCPDNAVSFAVSFCDPCRRCWKFCRTPRR